MSARAKIIDPRHQRDMARWYPLKVHPVQTRLVTDDVRIKIVPAGRRSGKTERAKRYVAREALRTVNSPYFIAAPTRSQVKQIYWEDMKRLCLTSVLGRDAVSESELTIKIPNGSSVTLVGLDQPQRIEGVFWAGGVVDEIGNVKENAWPENISPALDTFNPERPNYRPWCWMIGVPEGLNHYYDLAQYAETSGDPDWKLYHWKSADILPPDVIEAAKRRMSLKQYKQEYEASFETASGRVYEDFDRRNLVPDEIKRHEQLLWMHDFNYTPMSSAIGVVRNKDELFLLDEIVLESAVAKQSAQEFVERYKDHENKKILIYGDPAGRAGEKHGHPSDYVSMEEVLKKHGWEFQRQVKPAAPSIKDRQNSVRARICNAFEQRRLFVNPSKAKYCYKGLSTVQLKKGSSFMEEDSQYQHITTAIGYCIDYRWPVRHDKQIDETPVQGSKNYWNKRG